MSDSIKVAIKVRPLIKRERDDNLPVQWAVQGNSIISTDTEMKRRGDGGFCFDHIFDMNASNSDIFNIIVQPIVNAAVNGINGTVFAYGQTSSGKTYTMMGTEEEPGIVPLAIEYMFDAITNTAGREFLLRVSYLEIYNERVNDLLNKAGTDLKLKEDFNGQVILKCKEEITNCPENVLSIMKKGDKNRRIGETNMNERSSRSHTIFRITIESREAGGDSDGAIQVSQLNLVDLAGSERARQTGATGERFKEGRHINMSLSTLGLVIMQLSDSQDSQKHVNFRDSKLTRLLQNSLGGNAMTVIICAVTPAALEETQCTLSFASRAKSIKNKPQINEVMSDAALLKRYAKQLAKLQEELQKIKNQNRAAEVEEMESKLQEKDRLNQHLEERIELLKTRIVSGDNSEQEESFRCKSKRRQTWGGPGMFNQHLLAFQCKGSLSTIREMSFEKPQRKSIIQSMDNIMNSTFTTAFADFELELFESERNRDFRENISDSDDEPFITKHKNRVTFRDDVFTIRSRNDSFEATPEKCNISTQTPDYYASPSTPKHVLRQCITNLRKEFLELREFTTLEKQLLCQEDRCSAQKGEEDLDQTEVTKSAEECAHSNKEYNAEVRERLQSLNLTEEKDMDRIISELCVKLNEMEKENISEKELNNKTMKQFSDLERQIGNITLERDEFEYMSRELRAELKKKTVELELKNISEESIKREELKKIAELEMQIEIINSEKDKYVRICADLQNESTMKIAKLQKEVENIHLERNEFEHMRRELYIQLDKKSVELEALKNNSRITELETEIANGTSERDKFKAANDDLLAKIDQLSSEFESKIVLEQAEKQKAIEKVSELKAELDQKIADLGLKLESEQSANQEATKKVSELEKRIEDVVSEKAELETMNGELHVNVSELKSTIASQQAVHQQAAERISELEKKLEETVLEKSELQRVSEELRSELNKKTSELEEKVTQLNSQQLENEKIQEKISEFEEQIASGISEKNELERVNNELRIELEQKVSELNEKEIENQKTVENISELEARIESLTSERDKFELANSELNAKNSELDLHIQSSEIDLRNVVEKNSGLENQITELISERNKYESILLELRTELNEKNSELQQKVSEFKEKEMSEQTKDQEMTENILKLETQIENLISQKDKFELINSELRAQLDAKGSELNSHVQSSEADRQNAIGKISELESQIANTMSEKEELDRVIFELRAKLEEKSCELEKQIANVASEKNQLQYINKELRLKLNKKAAALKQRMALEKLGKQEVMEMIIELEVEIEHITTSKEELECTINELRVELDRKICELESKEIEKQRAEEKIFELSKQIEVIASERNQFEELNNRLNLELSTKTSELQCRIESEQAANREALEKIIKLEELVENITLKNSLDELEVEDMDESGRRESSEFAKKCDCIGENNGLKNRIKDLEDTLSSLHTNNQDLRDQLEDQSVLYSRTMNESNADTSSLMVNMEAEKSQLEETLQLKSQELEDIKSDVQSLKTDIKNLQDTIYLLTTENMEMASKLTGEQEKAKQTEQNLQKTIDELYARISQVTSEKIALEGDLAALNEQLESMRSKVSAMQDGEQSFASYQSKIDKLIVENIELSTCITEKNKELESIKESKSLLYEHECIYREKAVDLKEKNDCLLKENDELSTDLIDKIEENDMLKEQCDILKSKVEETLARNNESPNENCVGNDVEYFKTENNSLKAEIAELKMKVTILMEENAKFSNNLLETMDSLDSSRSEKPCDENKLEEETRESLINKVAALQNEVDQLTCLNKKLSDLKLASCNQCTHLKNPNESRRALKLETKVLNQKLEELQRKFDRKCEDTEALKRMNQELNSSRRDLSPNVSFVNEMNVSFVEERIQGLNNELQTLKADHDKLSLLYEDKCSELEHLQADATANAGSPSRKSLSANGNRIQQIQSYIDQLKKQMDEMKKSSMNFTVTLQEFNDEKEKLLGEIRGLKESNEELQEKVSNSESMATEKIQILENELTNASKDIELFSAREKELENQRLMLEVELEGLRVEEKNKCALINDLNDRITSLKNQLDLVTNEKNELINLNAAEERKEELMECLKKQCEELEKEKVQVKELEQHKMKRIRELEAHMNELQRNLTSQEHFCKQLQEKSVQLEKLVQEREHEKCALAQRLQAIEVETVEFRNNVKIQYKNEFNSVVQQHQQQLREYEDNLQKLNETLNKYIGENMNLTQELTDLRNIKDTVNEVMTEKERVCDQQRKLMNDNEKLKEELDDIKRCMIKELRSLKYNVASMEFTSKSVNEIFVVLLHTLVSKEEEMIKMIRETYETEKRKMEDEKEQCIDAEKRVAIWAKELEAEIEKLQAELTEREQAHREYQNKISQLEHLLRESVHEREVFREKMEALEADFGNLQTEFQKRCKEDSAHEEAIFVAQRREKEVQEIFKSKEVELEAKLKSEKETYEKEIKNLVHMIETYKTKMLELNGTIEGLEANEKQLKNIIEANSAEIKRNSQNVEKMNAEFEHLTQAYNEMCQEVEQKNGHIEEITTILKNKCDTLSEYKTKLETVLPEYEMLKEHVKDHKSTIERCKEEIELLKKDREEQLEKIRDRLNSEEIKNVGLTKQLNELNNKNISLIEQLSSLEEKYKELQEVNAKLERKIRNSTSKIKAEAEIEELKELNKRLQNNLEGASNRITEFQEMRNQNLKELVELQAKHELLIQQNNELEKALSLCKSRHLNFGTSMDENDKYNALLLEKNKIALELEDRKLLLSQKEKEIKEYAMQMQQLTNKNKELDEELEEYAGVIRERDSEISKLEEKLYSRLTENTLINELEEKMKDLREENGKLREQVEAFQMRLQMNVEDDVRSQNEKIIRDLKKENLELQAKINDYRKQTHSGKFKEIDLSRNMEDEEEKTRIAKELEAHRLLLKQKDKELNDYIKRIRDLIEKNREFEKELEKYGKTIRVRDGEISKLETKLDPYSMDNDTENDAIQKLLVLTNENKKLKSEIRELQMRLRIDAHHKRSILKDSMNKHHSSIIFDNDVSEYENKCQQLKKKIHELELQLVSKNGKIATLELQIQSENFPYQKKCKELEETVLAFRSKNAELTSEIKKLQTTLNDVNAWECYACRRWRINRQDQACQTIPSSNAIRFCSTSSGVVEDYVKIQKMEKEKIVMKELCRSRAQQIKELQERIKKLEETKKSVASKSK